MRPVSVSKMYDSQELKLLLMSLFIVMMQIITAAYINYVLKRGKQFKDDVILFCFT